jgi:hypothetical protein
METIVHRYPEVEASHTTYPHQEQVLRSRHHANNEERHAHTESANVEPSSQHQYRENDEDGQTKECTSNRKVYGQQLKDDSNIC